MNEKANGFPGKPCLRPQDPRFSSGPCKKFPGWDPGHLNTQFLGRSHRAKIPKTRLSSAIERSHALLNLPADWKLGIVPGSDTGAFEIAMWSMLGARPVEALVWDSFSADWAKDLGALDLPRLTVHEADYGDLPDLFQVDADNDVVFVYNGTTSGVRLPNLDWLSGKRTGLAFCDATSAAYAMPMDFAKLDVVTWSWQKVLGGEAAHGMIILSPRAVARLETYTPAWPLPKIFRLTKGGKFIEGIFKGETINTPSMLAVEDYLVALKWAKSIGGLDALQHRANANARAVWNFCAANDWIDNLAVDKATWSNTSVCLKFTDDRITDGAAFAKGVAKRLADENIALDIGAYRDAPAGLRIWCGATVETSDIEAMLPWLSWAFDAELNS